MPISPPPSGGSGDSVTSGSASPTVTNLGSGSVTANTCVWQRIGNIVTFHIEFLLTANGTGTGIVGVTGTTLPEYDTTNGTPLFLGRRRVVSAAPILAICANAGGEMTVGNFALVSAPTTNLIGTDFDDTQAYSVDGSYLAVAP